MPTLDFGARSNFDGGNKIEYIELNQKGDKLHIRILDRPVYDGKHFMQTNDGWDIHYCPRIMEKKPCPDCDKFFAAKKALKEMGDAKNFDAKQKAEAKKLEREADYFKATIQFYYPVLNRTTQEVGIFKTTQGVRFKLDQEVENGIDVTEYDYIITRAEQPGAGYYPLTRIDSAKTEPLTDKEVANIETTKEWDLEAMVTDTRASKQSMGNNTGFEEIVDEKEAEDLMNDDNPNGEPPF